MRPFGAPAPTCFASAASAELLHVNSLSVLGLPGVADVGVASANGGVTSDANVTARASNVSASLLGSGPGDLLALAEQIAPPTNPDPTEETALPLTVPAVVDLGVSTASAHAQAAAPTDTCLTPEVALSHSRVETAEVSLLGVPGLGTLLELPGTVSTRQSTSLPATTGDTHAVDLELLGGQIEVGVTETPRLTTAG